MEEDLWLVSLGLYGFLIAYAIYMLFTYRIDPRYSLSYEKPPSFKRLLWLPSVGKLVLLLLLAVLAVVPQRNLYEVFDLSTFSLTLDAFAFGIFGGVLIFAGGLPVNILISVVRRKFSVSQTKREVGLAELLSASMSKPQSNLFLNILTASVFAGVLEEIIFRGYLLGGHLLRLLPLFPAVAVLVQAVFAFVPQLYQGIYNALLSLYGSVLFGVVFFLSGSLFAVIVAHFVQDVIGFAFTFSSAKKKKQ